VLVVKLKTANTNCLKTIPDECTVVRCDAVTLNPSHGGVTAELAGLSLLIKLCFCLHSAVRRFLVAIVDYF